MAEKVIFEFEVNYDEAASKIIEFRKRIAELKDEKKKLEKELKDNPGNDALQRKLYDVEKQLSTTTSSMKGYEKELSTLEKINKANEGSLVKLREQLKLLTAQYDELGKEAREGALGQDLSQQINSLHEQVSELEQSTGRFQRNVGNYQSAFDASGESVEKFGGILSKVFGSDSAIGKAATIVQGFGAGLRNMAKDSEEAGKTVTDSLGEIGKADIAGGFEKIKTEADGATKVVRGFGRSLDEQGEKSKAAAAAATAAANNTAKTASAFSLAAQAAKSFGLQLLKLLANPIVAIIAAIAIAVMKVVQAFKKNDDAMTSLQRAFGAFRPILDLVNKGFALLADAIGKVINAVADAVQWFMSFIPVLRDYAKVNDDIVVSIDNLEEAERKFKVSSAKNQKEISELRAKAAQKDKYTFQERIAFLERAIELEEKDIQQRRKNAAEELRIAKLTAERDNDTSDETKNKIAELEAALILLDKELADKKREMQAQLSEFRLADKAATDAANKAREEERRKRVEDKKKEQQQIITLQREYNSVVIAMMAEGTNKEIAASREASRQKIEDYENAMKENKHLSEYYNTLITAERLRQQQEETEIIVKSEKERQAAIDEVRKKFTMEEFQRERELLEQRYQLGEITSEKEYREKKLEQTKIALFREMEAEINSAQYTEEQKEAIRAYYWERRRLAEVEFSQWQEQQNKETTEKIKAQEMERITSVVGATASVSAALANLLNQVAEDNEELSGFLKAVALVNLAVQTASSIANAVNGATQSAAATGPAAIATTPAFIATLVTTVLSAIGQAAAILGSTSIPSAPKFSTGGLVEGEGTATSDSIVAMLSTGESVMTAAATSAYAPLLSAMNQSVGGSAIGKGGDMRVIREMFRSIFAEMPAPEVSVREITSVSNKVKVKESIRRR